MSSRLVPEILFRGFLLLAPLRGPVLALLPCTLCGVNIPCPLLTTHLSSHKLCSIASARPRPCSRRRTDTLSLTIVFFIGRIGNCAGGLALENKGPAVPAIRSLKLSGKAVDRE